jgi:hypothetical protein
MKDLRKQSQTRPGLAENIRNGLGGAHPRR